MATFDIGTLAGKIELEDKLTNVLDKAGSAISKFNESWLDSGKSIAEGAASYFTGEAALEAVKAAGEAAVEVLKEITIEGSHAADVEDAFQHLSGGADAAQKSLETMRSGLRGTVTDMDLMTQQNKLMAAGLNLSQDQMATLTKGAFDLAKITGGDAVQAFDKISDAMLTGRVRGVQLLTGRIDLKAAEQDFAESLGVTTKELTAEGKIEAARQVILEKVGTASERVGETTIRLADKLQQAKVFAANFMEELGTAIATSPVLATGFDAIRDALNDAFGGKQFDLIKTIAHGVDDTAIAVLGLAEYVVKGVGIIGQEWNAALVVFDAAKAGWAAIAYVAEQALLLIEKGLNKVSFGALDDSVKNLQADVDRWYNSMAKSQKGIEDHKKVEDAWVASADAVNQQIEAIKKKMEAARDTEKDFTGVIRDEKKAHEDAATAAAKHGEEEDAYSKYVKQSEEETKKYRQAWQDILSVGKDFHATLDTINGTVVDAVKYYLSAGVSLEKLRTAYQLTEAQAEAIKKEWEEDNKVLKAQVEQTQALARVHDALQVAIGGTSAALKGLSGKRQSEIEDALRAHAAESDIAKAYGVTVEVVKAVAAAMKEADAAMQEEAKTLDDNAQKVQLLSGEYVTLKEAIDKFNSGGGFTYDLTTEQGVQQFRQMNPGDTISWSDQQIIDFAKKGGTLEQLFQMGVVHMRSFATGSGGVQDFGTGTHAVLHGREAVVTEDQLFGMGGDQFTNHWYVNGTGADVARQAEAILMRRMKTRRQFGAR